MTLMDSHPAFLAHPNNHIRGRSALLRMLGFPKSITFDDASERLKACIVYARKRGDETAAAHFSEAKEFLKKRLKHRCLDCPELVSPESERCHSCANKQKRGPRPYRVYAPISVLVNQFVKTKSHFFLDEVCHWVNTQHNAPHRLIHRSVYDALYEMTQRGLISGGGVANWRRYEKVKS